MVQRKKMRLLWRRYGIIVLAPLMFIAVKYNTIAEKEGDCTNYLISSYAIGITLLLIMKFPCAIKQVNTIKYLRTTKKTIVLLAAIYAFTKGTLCIL